MTFKAVVYFAGPMTVWSGKPDEREHVACFESRFRWLARRPAVIAHRYLNAGTCGWVLYDGAGAVLEHVEAVNISVDSLA